MLASLLNLFKVADGNIDITKLGGAEYVADSGSANAYVATLSPALASYTAGTVVMFKAAHANTSSSTVNVNSLGTKNITRPDGTALMQGDILANQIVYLFYDGTEFILMNPAVLSVFSYVATSSWVNGIKITGGATGTGPTISPDGPSADANSDLILAGKGTGKVKVNAHYGVLTSDTDGATITFDASVSNKHTVTLGGNRTLAISNDTAGEVVLIDLVQDGTGSRTVTWWSGIKWAGGSPPTLTTTASKADTLGIRVITAGSAYYGYVVGQNL